jgi:hypothetical protein
MKDCDDNRIARPPQKAPIDDSANQKSIRPIGAAHSVPANRIAMGALAMSRDCFALLL